MGEGGGKTLDENGCVVLGRQTLGIRDSVHG